MQNKRIRELRKCLGCPNYFWAVEENLFEDNNASLRRYCKSCLEKRINIGANLDKIEDENTPTGDELTEEEKQFQNTIEELAKRRDSNIESDLSYRRYKTN